MLYSHKIIFYTPRRAHAQFELVWAKKDLQQYGKPRNLGALANEVNTTLSKAGGAGTLRKLIMLGE